MRLGALPPQAARTTLWMHEAACAGLSWDWLSVDLAFFSEPSSNAAAAGWHGIARARRVCSRCPVRRECLLSALQFEAEAFPSVVETRGRRRFGVVHSPVRGLWGGTTEQERQSTAHLPMDERVAALENVFAEQVRGVLASDERITA